MMEKLVTWLVVLVAVVFLARPQSDKAAEKTEIIASAEYAEDNSNYGEIILFFIIIVIVFGTVSDACGSEELNEN